MEKIQVTKAKVHNLKNIDVSLPRHSLTVITGPSGSGKSSLAFDTIYAEGQRRYIESLSSYARQFIGQIEAPEVESITGLSPAIAIDQKSTTKNPRSTVGTITEIYDYLRLLYARLGEAHCPETGEKVAKQSPQQIVEQICKFKTGTKLQILSPVIRSKKGEHKEELAKYTSMGFTRVRLNGEIMNLEDNISINKSRFNDIDIVVDRLVIKEGVKPRLTESVENALKLSDGYLVVLADEVEHFYSEKNYSFKSGKSYPDLEPRLFSFNSPLGACPTCNGLGISKRFDIDGLLFDEKLSLEEGAMPIVKKNSFLMQMVRSVAEAEKVDIEKPFHKLSEKFRTILYDGSDKVYNYKFESENSSWNFKKEFPGVVAWLEKKYNESESEKTRADLEEYMIIKKCPSCKGKKLSPFALAATIKGQSIMDVCDLSINEAAVFFDSLEFTGNQAIIAHKVLKEVKDRIKFLLNVGLNYLTLNRDAMTLSGGESQRIRLATQIGSALSGVLYVLDEPSIGLHQRDNEKLIKTLIDLRDIGNTVLVVEHDEDTMLASDYLIDMGPQAGIHGGEIVAAGTPEEVKKNKKSITGKYLSGDLKIEVPKKRRDLKDHIVLNKAKEHNLQDVTLKLPLGGMTCITGVSGSGKSTLVHKVLIPAVKNYLSRGRRGSSANYQSITGVDKIQSLIELDQSPIGRTPHSNPATYTGLFDDIRNIFSQTNESKVRGYKPGRFSFNVKGGRCETCEGNGMLKIEMHFLPDVYVTCSECRGSRYNNETLSILYRGKNIADVLAMSIEEAEPFFENHPKVNRALKVLNAVGLGYIKLGQPATTLSGGEAQRLKLSRELSKSTKGSCLYVLDEPTTGLHFEDINILLKALNKLIDQNHSLLIIEHNLDVIKTADWVIDLGPEGGKGGGQIIAEGTPETVAKVKASHTGRYLAKALKS
ncbi:excinuclease ABC subunit UvrA [Peredibacter starrii]|uniref:UvrABC system protein A n=1 Tax=Peredibacter starrii TaxID=28202 RepID=A0AAX4HQH6_9BACT|nr:excinuclease ABC subunit UvrA [Peredibacter starrii]WPU65412.1 excinuclease ABC subunit UvrA [Peredibacter starrii]